MRRRFLDVAPGTPKGERRDVLAASPEFLQVQSAILGALAPYPDALAAVMTALQPVALT